MWRWLRGLTARPTASRPWTGLASGSSGRFLPTRTAAPAAGTRRAVTAIAVTIAATRRPRRRAADPLTALGERLGQAGVTAAALGAHERDAAPQQHEREQP